MNKFLVIVASIVGMSGCATRYPAIPEGYTGPKANIADSYTNHTGSKAHYFELSALNGKHIETSSFKTRMVNLGRGFDMTPTMVKRDVPANQQTFTISGFVHFATDGQGLFGNDMAVRCDLMLTPVEAENYVVKGSLSVSESWVWIEDSKGNVFGEKCSQKFR